MGIKFIWKMLLYFENNTRMPVKNEKFQKLLKFLFFHFLLSTIILPSEMQHIYIWLLPELNFASMKRLSIFRYLTNSSKNPSLSEV